MLEYESEFTKGLFIRQLQRTVMLHQIRINEMKIKQEEIKKAVIKKAFSDQSAQTTATD